MKWKKIGVTVSAAALLTTGLVVGGTALSASAHEQTVTNTCSELDVNAQYYSPSVPADPGQPYIAPTPGTPAVPGTPEVPATYVQEYKYVFKGDGQNGGDKFEWHPADWNVPTSPWGVPLWQKTGEHRDTTTILTPEVPATPGTPAVPGTPGQPYIAPTEAKTNHVEVWTDGGVRADQDFSTSFTGSWLFGDPTVAHTYRVVISSWDGIGNLDTGTRDVAACQVTPPPTVTKPVATVSVDNCMYDANGNAVDRPLVLLFDNTGSNVPVDFTVEGFAQFNRTVPAGETTQVDVPFATFPSGTLNVSAAGQSFALVVPGCVQAPEKPAPIVTTTPVTTVDCKADTATTVTTTSTTNFSLLSEDGKLSWVADEPVITTSTSTVKATAAQCPPVIVPPVVTPPVVTPPVVTPPVSTPPAPSTTKSVASTPVAQSSTQVLAHTGSDIPDWVLWLLLGLIALGLALLVIGVTLRKRRTE